MKYFLVFALLIISMAGYAQKSDFIVLKKKNNRTLKTYFPGTYLYAVTNTGFTLSGIIKRIDNDSVVVEQQNVVQVPTQFGVPALDTIRFTVAVDYRDIYKFLYANNTGTGGAPRSSGGKLLIPKLMLIGGIGFIVVELVNTAYRKESLSDGNKIPSIAIAAGVAAAGALWIHFAKKADKAGGKYVVKYVEMGD